MAVEKEKKKTKKIVAVRNVKIGTGMPKICVPVAGSGREEILSAARRIPGTSADLAEWRADWYKDVFVPGRTEDILRELRNLLGDMPLLFTFRTLQEGGEKKIRREDYVDLNRRAVQSGCIDLVDVELSAGEAAVNAVAETARAFDVRMIVSSHDFCGTPSREEIVSRLKRMQTLGADIMKIAVMPKNREDVLTLLGATADMTEKYADRPVITMSMSETGVITRLCGEEFGSAVTFGALERASAPGQMNVEDLAVILRLLHRDG